MNGVAYDVRAEVNAGRTARLTRIVRRLLADGPMEFAELVRRMHAPAGELERVLKAGPFVEDGRYWAGAWIGWRPVYRLKRLSHGTVGSKGGGE